MSELKPYLVDVPVRVNIWIRPECQRKQFEVLKQARPSTMFLISDGGRNEKEWKAIYQNREIFDNEIDWECTVYKIYEDKNNGLYTMGRKGAELIWSKVDRCIFLEDDQLVSISYFRFCQELLEKYKDDERVVAITAMNYAGDWKECSSDYFFAERGSIWGTATWRRCAQARDPEHLYKNDPYTMKLLKERTKHVKYMYKTIEGYSKNAHYMGHVAGGEFFNRFAVYSQNQLYIVPKKNMMNNIGCTENAAHSTEYKLLPRALKKLYNTPLHELEFPLKHPMYLIPDQSYRALEDKTLGRDRPIVQFFRRIESLLLSIRYGVIFKKLKKRNARKNKIEK